MKRMMDEKIIGNVGKGDLEKITKLHSKKKSIRNTIDHLIDMMTEVECKEQSLLQKHIKEEDAKKYDCFGLDRRTGEITGITKKSAEEFAMETTREIMSKIFDKRNEQMTKEPSIQ